MSSPILKTLDLSAMPWPTLDPFLFCVHHDDAYPRGNAKMGPDAPLTGRNIGMDFEGIDGWAHVPRRRRPGLSAPSPPRLRDGHAGSRRLRRSLRLARGHRALRQGRRPVDDRGTGRRALRDVPAGEDRRAQSHRSVPDLAQPARRGQDGRATLQDAVARHDPVRPGRGRRRTRLAGTGVRRSVR